LIGPLPLLIISSTVESRCSVFNAALKPEGIDYVWRGDLGGFFLARAWTVRHIMDNGCHEHKLPPFARLEGNQIYYRG
jgi:hypothetical protein